MGTDHDHDKLSNSSAEGNLAQSYCTLPSLYQIVLFMTMLTEVIGAKSFQIINWKQVMFLCLVASDRQS